MSAKETALQRILDKGMLPLYYHENPTVCLQVALALYKAGIRAIEFTNRGSAALENFKLMKKAMAAEAPDLSLGIGTVKSAQEATAFIEAGADFVVSPIVNGEVAALAAKAGLLWIPGCMTPTEIFQAQQLQAAMIKIFPANILGPAFMSSIRELFPGQLFIPTGGVELELDNIRAWFLAGVSAVGMGSKLITREVLEQYDKLYQQTVKALELVGLGRGE